MWYHCTTRVAYYYSISYYRLTKTLPPIGNHTNLEIPYFEPFYRLQSDKSYRFGIKEVVNNVIKLKLFCALRNTN